MTAEHAERTRKRSSITAFVALIAGAAAIAVGLGRLVPHYSDLRERADELTKENGDLTRQRDALQAESAGLTKQRDRLAERNAKLVAEGKHLKTRNADLRRERDALGTQLAALKKEKARLADEARNASVKMAKRASEFDRLRPLVDTIRAFNATLLVRRYNGVEAWSGFEGLLPGRGGHALQYAVDRFFEVWNLNVETMRAAGADDIRPKKRGVNHPEIGARIE